MKAQRTNTDSAWRPPGWQTIRDEEGIIAETPAEVADVYDKYKAKGYYGRGLRLSKSGTGRPDADAALVAAENMSLLDDTWNTAGYVWQLGEFLIGRVFKVDPFHNPGATSLPGLLRTLDGSGDQDDDMRPTSGLAADDNKNPLHWRGDLEVGDAPAAANGPHSCTAKWLALCAAYGQHDICAAFVPDNGDGWFQVIGMTAQIYVKLGRVSCSPPPGKDASSPRGNSALLIWIPPTFDVKTLPVETQGVLRGKPIRVPMYERPRSGMQFAHVQPGQGKKPIKTVDFFGILSEQAAAE